VKNIRRKAFTATDEAGGLLRATSRPTLNRRSPESWTWVTHRSVVQYEPCPRVCISIDPEGKSCTDPRRDVVLNNPHARVGKCVEGRFEQFLPRRYHGAGEDAQELSVLRHGFGGVHYGQTVCRGLAMARVKTHIC